MPDDFLPDPLGVRDAAKWMAATDKVNRARADAGGFAPPAALDAPGRADAPAAPGLAGFAGHATYNFPAHGGFDVADRLPEPARAKLLALRDAREGAHALLLAAADAKREAAASRQDAFLRLQHLSEADVPPRITLKGDAADFDAVLFPRAGPLEHVSILDSDNPSVAEPLARYRRANAGLKRATVLEEERSSAFHAIAGLLDNTVTPWLRGLPGGAQIESHDGTAAKLKKGETAADAVARLRGEIDELRADLHAARTAPIPPAEAKAAARRQIEALTARGKPDARHLAEAALDISWPTVGAGGYLTVPSTGAHVGGTVDAPDGIGVLAWLFKDQMIAAVEAEIDEINDGIGALGAEERRTREGEILAALLDAERAEEGIIEQGAGAISRRPDADPRAVLGLADDLPGAAQT